MPLAGLSVIYFTLALQLISQILLTEALDDPCQASCKKKSKYPKTYIKFYIKDDGEEASAEFTSGTCWDITYEMATKVDMINFKTYNRLPSLKDWNRYRDELYVATIIAKCNGSKMKLIEFKMHKYRNMTSVKRYRYPAKKRDDDNDVNVEAKETFLQAFKGLEPPGQYVVFTVMKRGANINLRGFAKNDKELDYENFMKANKWEIPRSLQRFEATASGTVAKRVDSLLRSTLLIFVWMMKE